MAGFYVALDEGFAALGLCAHEFEGVHAVWFYGFECYVDGFAQIESFTTLLNCEFLRIACLILGEILRENRKILLASNINIDLSR